MMVLAGPHGPAGPAGGTLLLGRPLASQENPLLRFLYDLLEISFHGTQD